MADQTTTAVPVEPSTHTPTPDVQEQAPANRVYLGNIAYETTKEQVEEFVKPAGGNIANIELPLRFGRRPGGFAFITYETEAEAQQAVEKLQGQSLNEREVSVALAKSDVERKKEHKAKTAARKARKRAEKAAAAPTDAPADAPASEPAVQDGTVGPASDAPKKKKRSNKKRAARRIPEEGDDAPAEEAPVTSEEVAKVAAPKKAKKSRAAKVPGAEEARIDNADGEASAPKEKKPKERKPKFAATGAPSKTLLFVANLPFDVDDSGLSDLFTKLDITVTSARVITKPHFKKDLPPRSKGFGFVEVANEDQQKLALEKLDGHAIGERALTVKIANEREPITEDASAEIEAAKEEVA